MLAQEFRSVLSEYFLPIFRGIRLKGTRSSSAAHALVAYEGPCVILMKPHKTANFRIELFRSQPFSSDEKRFISQFAREFEKAKLDPTYPYFHDLLAAVPRQTVAQWLTIPARAKKTVHECILQFEELAAQTYEGKAITSALGVTGSNNYGNVMAEEAWREDFSRVLSNGFDSLYVCGVDGKIFNVQYLSTRYKSGFFPIRLAPIANWSLANNRVAIVLNRNGEVLIFHRGQLNFARRRGVWIYYSHESVIRKFGGGIPIALKNAVFESCLDVSFSRSGGCIAILSSRKESQISKLVAQDDLIVNTSIARTKLLKKTITKKFHLLDRRLRQELLAMDGATILDHKGNIVTAGAIVKVPGGSSGGGRRAAAMALSNLGLAVKISADGPITGFRQKAEAFST